MCTKYQLTAESSFRCTDCLHASATETSKNIEIKYDTKFKYQTLQEANNKITDQTPWMPRMVCTFLFFCMQHSQVYG